MGGRTGRKLPSRTLLFLSIGDNRLICLKPHTKTTGKERKFECKRVPWQLQSPANEQTRDFDPVCFTSAHGLRSRMGSIDTMMATLESLNVPLRRNRNYRMMPLIIEKGQVMPSHIPNPSHTSPIFKSFPRYGVSRLGENKYHGSDCKKKRLLRRGTSSSKHKHTSSAQFFYEMAVEYEYIKSERPID